VMPLEHDGGDGITDLLASSREGVVNGPPHLLENGLHVLGERRDVIVDVRKLLRHLWSAFCFRLRLLVCCRLSGLLPPFEPACWLPPAAAYPVCSANGVSTIFPETWPCWLCRIASAAWPIGKVRSISTVSLPASASSLSRASSDPSGRTQIKRAPCSVTA